MSYLSLTSASAVVTISAATMVVLTVLLLLAVLFRKLSYAGVRWQPMQPGAANIAARYAPMKRLLDESEIRFVASHPAFGKTRMRKLRAQRREIFRAYLHCMARDYARVCSAIRIVMMESGIDRPDLAKALMRNRTIFTAALVGIELRLALHACGIGTIDIRPLVASLEGMRNALESLATPGIALPSPA